jgi:hypothetical protein
VQHNDLVRISCDSVHRIGNGLRGISRRGEYFQDLQRGILKPDTVSKCAAAINGDSKRGTSRHKTRDSKLNWATGPLELPESPKLPKIAKIEKQNL